MKPSIKHMLVILVVGVCTPHSAFAQVQAYPYQTYRVEYDTVYDRQQVTAYRVEYETVYDEQQVTTYRPEWVTQVQDRKYTVQRQVPETAMRDEQYTTYEQVVTYRPQTIDQGGWENQYTTAPGRVRNRLTWQPGAYILDPATGTTRYRWPGLYWTPMREANQTVVRSVYRPNYVNIQVPQTSLVPRTQTRKVPVTTYRTVSETVVEKVPVKVCRWVPQIQTVRTPRVVEKRVPVTYERIVPRHVERRVPIQTYSPVICCGGTYTAPPVYQAPVYQGAPMSPAGSYAAPPSVTQQAQGTPAQGDAASVQPTFKPNSGNSGSDTGSSGSGDSGSGSGTRPGPVDAEHGNAT